MFKDIVRRILIVGLRYTLMYILCRYDDKGKSHRHVNSASVDLIRSAIGHTQNKHEVRHIIYSYALHAAPLPAGTYVLHLLS
jgi:hypothetical protein